MRVVSTRHLLILAGALWGACCGSLVASAGETRVNQWRSNKSGTPQFVAIMGEVGRPGVFELTNPLPELSDLVRLAGGTSNSASGSVRIMRAGRMMQLFMSPKLHYLLLPNDLIVVEAKQFSTVRNFADSKSTDGTQPISNGTSRATEPTIVQLGLVNLIGRPVILDVAPGQAQLNQVLSLLRQASAGQGSITLIKPGSGMQVIPLDDSANTPLSSGTVLIFNPTAVNVGALPKLPNTVRPNSNTADGGPSTIEPATSKVSATDSAARVPAESSGDRPLLLPQGNSPSPPRALSVSPAESVPNAVSGASAQVFDLPAASDNETPDPAVAADDEKPSETIEEPQPAAEQIAAKSPWAISGTTWGMMAGLLVCCLAPWLWSRRKKPASKPVIVAEASESDTAETSLDKLIAGSLKIVEEPLELAFEATIFGRPVKRPKLMFDRAHALVGPHYTNSPGAKAGSRREAAWQGAGYSPVEPPASDDQGYALAGARDDQTETLETGSHDAVTNESAIPADALHERKVRVDKAHRRHPKGVLDRVLATFEGDHS